MSRQRWLLVAVLPVLLGPEATPAVVEEAGEGHVAESTREMESVLRERAALVDPARVEYAVNDRRAEWLLAQLGSARTPTERTTMRFDYARELIHAGRVEDAVFVIDQIRSDVERMGSETWHRAAPMLLNLKAVAWLRLAEERNCHLGHESQSCLLPIRGKGIHRDREGSTRAIGVLEEVLRIAPGDLRARWLLNVAHMTLGQYPDGVPPEQLIPPDRFEAEYPLARFENVARRAGLDAYGLSGGAVLDDLDGDGWLDLMVSGFGFEDQLRFFRNTGGGRFEERTGAAGITGELGGLNLVQADYDNDGRTDVLVLRGGWFGTQGRLPLSLLRNEGGGRFADVTREAGLFRLAPSQTAVWLDYDGDGWLDLYVGNESLPDSGPHPCQLYRSRGDGTFEEVGAAAGVDVVGFVKSVVSGDYDDDGRPDLYVSLLGDANRLLRNDGPGESGVWRFSDRAVEAGVAEPARSFPSFFFDYDNDGRLDLFVAGYGAEAEDVAAEYLGLPTPGERSRLYRNRGDGTFEDVSWAARLDRVILAMGLNYGDLDSDGWLDFYAGTGNPDMGTLIPNRMFRNAGGRVFQDVTTAGDFGNLQKGHAICFGDVDNDGDQDVFEQMGGAYHADRAYSTLFENPGHDNAWVGLVLEGARSNRAAIGARVEVVAETASGDARSLHRVVGSGGSFGASPLRLHVGLGEARRIVVVRVRWPAAGVEPDVYRGLEPGRWYRVREGGEATASEPYARSGPSGTRSTGPVGRASAGAPESHGG